MLCTAVSNMMESRVDCPPNTILQRHCYTDVYYNSGERKLRRLEHETGLSCHSSSNVKLVLRFEMTQQASIAECREHWDSTKVGSVEYLSII